MRENVSNVPCRWFVREMGKRQGSPRCPSAAARREARVVKSSFKAAILFVLIAVTAYLAFYYAPIERSMGVIQKIFYLHISCAFSAFVAFGTCFYANLQIGRASC